MLDPRQRTVALRGALPVLLACSLVFAASSSDDDEPWELVEPAPTVPFEPEELDRLDGITCTECHADVVAEWASTAHGLAWVDVEYQDRIGSRKRPELCHACHIPTPLLAGGELARPKAREDDLHYGVSCETCHLGEDGAMLGLRGAETDAHASRKSEHLSAPGSNELCSRCHATNIGPVIGIAKDFHSSKQAERGRSCVGCHMAPKPAVDATSDGGTVEAAARVVRSHALQTPRDPTFLRRAFELELAPGGKKVIVRNRAGHRVPGLIGREIEFTARALDDSGAEVGVGTLTLDARHYLPVDGELEIELDGAGTRVAVIGLHEDPRAIEKVTFLEVELGGDRR